MKSCMHVAPGSSQCFACERRDLEYDMYQRQLIREAQKAQGGLRQQEIANLTQTLGQIPFRPPLPPFMSQDFRGGLDFIPLKKKKKKKTIKKTLYERLSSLL